MSANENDPEIIKSKHCQDVMVDGHRFSINIVCSDIDPAWCMEVVDENGMSHVWDATFDNDSEALQAAMIAFDDEGARGFLQPESNVVPFSR